MEQLTLDHVEQHFGEPVEMEALCGQTQPSFPVIITPTTLGAAVQAPADVDYRVYPQEDGSTVVALRFQR